MIGMPVTRVRARDVRPLLAVVAIGCPSARTAGSSPSVISSGAWRPVRRDACSRPAAGMCARGSIGCRRPRPADGPGPRHVTKRLIATAAGQQPAAARHLVGQLVGRCHPPSFSVRRYRFVRNYYRPGTSGRHGCPRGQGQACVGGPGRQSPRPVTALRALSAATATGPAVLSAPGEGGVRGCGRVGAVFLP